MYTGPPFHGAILLKVLLEKACRLHIHTHGSKHNGKVILVPINNALRLFHQTSLATEFSCNLYKRQGQREIDRQREREREIERMSLKYF